MVVDQANAFAFKIDDIEERQSHVNFEALATSSGAFSLKRKYDFNVLQAMADGAGIAGADDASLAGGLLSTNTALGTADSPVAIHTTEDNAVNLMLEMAKELDEQSVLEENRWFVASPAFYSKLFAAGSKFAEVQVTGDQTSPLRNGLVMQGNIAGFRCYKSTALTTGSTDSVSISGVTERAVESIVLAGHVSSTSTASHINQD
jgi:P22 coat protein - gene protein 5.